LIFLPAGILDIRFNILNNLKMNYYHKYLKYKNKYICLKELMQNADMSGGKSRKKRSKWDQMVGKRKKELVDIKTTKSFIPFNKLTIKDKNYFILDNGGRPFKVVANANGIQIYKVEYKDVDENDEPIYNQIILEFKQFIGYWSGFDSSPHEMHGNSILIKLSDHKYVFVGWKIYQFDTTEKILDYVSPVGNSDVPYPVAFGETYVYFMLDKQLVNKNELETEVSVVNAEDLYGEFYGHVGSKKRLNKIPMKKVVVLQENLW
jgi:hypothetical protein